MIRNISEYAEYLFDVSHKLFDGFFLSCSVHLVLSKSVEILALTNTADTELKIIKHIAHYSLSYLFCIFVVVT